MWNYRITKNEIKGTNRGTELPASAFYDSSNPFALFL